MVSIEEGSFLSTAGSTFFVPGTIDNNFAYAGLTFATLIGPVPGTSGNGTLAEVKVRAPTQETLQDFFGAPTGAIYLFLGSGYTLLDSSLNDIKVFPVDSAPIQVVVLEPPGLTWLGAAVIFLFVGFKTVRNLKG